jgi:hypothetical protein
MEGNRMYSLASAPVLGFDLARLAGGPATAEVLLRALRLDRADLPVLADQLPGDGVRVELWRDVAEATRLMPSLRSLAGTEPAHMLDLVTTAPIGTLDSLLRCVRHDVMAWTWDGHGCQDHIAERATALLCDAVASTYLRDRLDPLTRRGLAAAWVAAMRRLSAVAPVDLGPHHYAVSSLLERLRTLRPAEVPRLEHTADDWRRNPMGWPTAMHSASWAAYLAGRIRTAAAGQLLLVQAVEAAAIPLPVRAAGAWNLLSGAVAALIVRDLLDQQTAHRLMAPVVAALGPACLA